MPVSRGATGPPFAAILSAAKSGEGWALSALFQRWNQPLSAFASARGVADIDDVVSETFLDVFRSIAQFEGHESDFRTWLFQIARRKIADSVRRAGRLPLTTTLGEELDSPGGDVELDAMREVERQIVATLLARLTDDQTEVLLLRIVGDLTIKQIATVMGRRPGAIKAHQRRGLAKLQRLLADTGGAEQVRTSRRPMERDWGLR